MITTASLATALIHVLEGCRLTTYRDSRGVLTIAWGHTGPEVVEGLICTLTQAQAWFAVDSAPLLAAVNGLPVLRAAALTSFGYNCGLTALQRVLRGEITVQAEEFWAGSQPYGEVAGSTRPPGLLARRQLEASLIELSRQS